MRFGRTAFIIQPGRYPTKEGYLENPRNATNSEKVEALAHSRDETLDHRIHPDHRDHCAKYTSDPKPQTTPAHSPAST
jgi:hypothetical protein